MFGYAEVSSKNLRQSTGILKFCNTKLSTGNLKVGIIVLIL